MAVTEIKFGGLGGQGQTYHDLSGVRARQQRRTGGGEPCGRRIAARPVPGAQFQAGRTVDHLLSAEGDEWQVSLHIDR